MDSILAELVKPKVFDAFVQENMKLSTYKAEYKAEMDVEYSSSKAYHAYMAEHEAAIVGSVIDKNAEKPTHVMPTANKLFGSIGRIADEWQMDNDRLDQYLYLEGRYKDKYGSLTANTGSDDYRKLIKYLFDPFEKAVIAPQKRIDVMYFHGLFNGTMEVTAKDNSKGNVTYSLPIEGVKAFKALTTTWGTPTATPIADMEQVVDYFEGKGKTVLKVRMSKSTFRKMCKANEIANALKIKLNKVDVQPAGLINVNAINEYLEAAQLPTIVIEPNRFVTFANGTQGNATPDDRVVFQCAEKVAVLKVADAIELVDPLPNKVYSVYDDNLVGMFRNEKGRFTDYEMWAHPVFTGAQNFAILKTDVI